MKGILFKPWKIKAIAEDDREWQTRRLGGLKEINVHPDEWVFKFKGTFDGKFGKFWFQHPQCERDDWLYNRYIKPRYQVGEVVYIKEATYKSPSYVVTDEKHRHFVYYKADNIIVLGGRWEWEANSLSPRFMPERFARYFIKITDIRAERLQEISDADCKAEGVQEPCSPYLMHREFEELWDSINKDYPWESNPFVFVYSFKKAEK